ncbi:MAG: sulfate reduction electron transfer complex DsrMKJOP subunit DsrM [Gammaproteobacteria bacterium]|nr:MAG: sulfate reduction electron transfer complex DsrMKJOP subunit DsrM [Gammaproteobacteria bacterium]
MSAASITYAILFYAATALFVVGLWYKIWVYWRTPAPLKIPTTPAPTTRVGVVWRLIKEVTLFESLFKSNLWIWIFGWMFHFALLLAFIRHLRYILEPVPLVVALAQPFGQYGAFAMLVGLTGLFARRVLVDRVRYISSPSDYLMLLLIIAIASSGVWMTYISHTDVAVVKDFFLGLMVLQIKPLPTDLPLLVHLSLVLLLMIIFPISKLLHAPGIFFSPTLNQVDNPREQRHLAPWAAELESNKK